MFPDMYSSKDDFTTFQTPLAIVTLDYRVRHNVPSPASPLATLKVTLDDELNELNFSCEYALPANFKTGRELPKIEEGLYGLIDYVLR